MTPIQKLLSEVNWQEYDPAEISQTDEFGTYCTHSGILEIAGFPPLRVYRLSTGQDIINAEDLENFFMEISS